MILIDVLRNINKEISNFLQIRWVKFDSLYLNHWSIMHLFSGFLIMFLISRRIKKENYSYLLFLEILILWELFEIFMRFTGMTFSGLFVFKMESVTDVLLDISLGMIGGFVYLIFSNKK